MIKKYFVAQGSNKEGPYSIEELTKKGITDQYSIWTEGMENWLNAQEFAELKDILQRSPPPTPHEIKKQKNIAAIQGALIVSLILHIFVGVIVFIVAGGFLHGEDLVSISRNLPKPVCFSDGWDAKRFYLIVSFLLIPSPISLLNGYCSYKAIYKNPEYVNRATKFIFIGGAILIPLTIFTSHKYFSALYPAKYTSSAVAASSDAMAPAVPSPLTAADSAEWLASFVLIRGGEFMMGSPTSEYGRDSDETQHQVRVSNFLMSKYAVTVAEFKRFVDATGYLSDAEKKSNTQNWRYGVSGVRT